MLVCFVLEAQHGVGRFSKDITDEDEQVLSKLVYYHSIIVMVGLSLVKISLAVFLRRFSSTLLSKALVGSISGCTFEIAQGYVLSDSNLINCSFSGGIYHCLWSYADSAMHSCSGSVGNKLATSCPLLRQ